MNFITLIFFVVAWAVVFSAQILEGGSPASLFTHPAPLLLVFGGTIAIGLMGLNGSSLKSVWVAGLRALKPKKLPDPVETYREMVSFAEVARRDGLLALESATKEVQDPFMKRALELVIDGTDADVVAETLDADTHAMEARHKVGQQFYTAMGGYAPTIGIIGTVMGMIHVLESLDDPDAMGPAIAVAFLATLWGVGSANLIWLPIAAKLKTLTQTEVAYRGMVLDGVLAIQSGSTPRQVGELLISHLSPKQRAKATESKTDSGKG